MIYGVGVDIENHNRFKKYLNDQNQLEIALPIYSKKELSNYSQYKSHLCFAISFCCKEAFFKAFGDSWDEECMWNDIELIFHDAPEKKNIDVLFSGRAKRLIEQNNICEESAFDYLINENSIIFHSLLACRKN